MRKEILYMGLVLILSSFIAADVGISDGGDTMFFTFQDISSPPATDGTNTIRFYTEGQEVETYTATSDSGDTVFFGLSESSGNQKPTYTNYSLFNESDQEETNTSEDVFDTLEHGTEYYFTLDGIEDEENDTVDVTYTVTNSSGFVKLSDTNTNVTGVSGGVASSTTDTSAEFNLTDYMNHTYTINITDANGATTTISGTLSLTNQAPNVTGIVVSNDVSGGAECVQNVDCDIEVLIDEDACTETPTESAQSRTPGGVLILDDSSLDFVNESDGICRRQANLFAPPVLGTHTFTYNITDSQGESDSFSTTYEVIEHPGIGTTSGGGGGGGGGGGDSVDNTPTQVTENLSFTPTSESYTLTKGASVIKEIRVVNDGLQDETIDVYVSSDSSPAVLEWVEFFGSDGATRIDNVVIPVGGEFTANFRQVRYEVNVPTDALSGVYTLYIVVESDNPSVEGDEPAATYTATITVDDSQLTRFLSVLKTPLYEKEFTYCKQFSLDTTGDDGCAEESTFTLNLSVGLASLVVFILIGGIIVLGVRGSRGRK